MQNLIAAIHQSCAQENWYAALYMALTMPDICAKLEDPASKQSGERYQAWFNIYLKPTYKSEFHGPDFHFLTVGDLWALRCSLLHEGTDEITQQRAREVLRQFKFTTQTVHCLMTDDVLVLNVDEFCTDMTEAVERWLSAMSADVGIQQRIAEMASIETSGFSPAAHMGIGGSDELGMLT
ncbi:hypothetical protein [Thiobacillus sp.]|uniref:hypothetical protein n=1 Tax=Thiobacillus sp. TaxID=924 RepID=UPI00180E33C8|nr:hypothetical protein [Thiobacillus sp.]MBC2731432.1 hypothetical protein [Thiobacillus sp.]MBC2740169.1 hypothetical protein [Thiobacillus sp.]MBC2758382.1 hypothetical protein [Thiobacillus sp.]